MKEEEGRRWRGGRGGGPAAVGRKGAERLGEKRGPPCPVGGREWSGGKRTDMVKRI